VFLVVGVVLGIGLFSAVDTGKSGSPGVGSTAPVFSLPRLGARDRAHVGERRPHSEADVLVGVELVVETGRVAQQADPPANRRVDAQVVRQHLHSPAARINSPAQTRLAGAIGPPHRNDLPGSTERSTPAWSITVSMNSGRSPTVRSAQPRREGGRADRVAGVCGAVSGEWEVDRIV
jgi:hypothetical protein